MRVYDPEPMGTVIIGIDPASTKLAAMTASGSRRTPVLHDHTFRKLGDRWSTEASTMALYWAWDVLAVARSYGDPIVYIEMPLIGRGGVRSTMVQAFTNGALQAAFGYEDVPVRMVNVQTWKKELAHGAKVPSGKPALAGLVGEQWSDAAMAASGNEDLIDAAGICLYGLSVEDTQRRLAGQGGV